MQAVILAAGRGTRMKKLTEDTPKPLLVVDEKTLLHHKLAELPEAIDEVILIIGYHGDKIRVALGEECEGKKIRYVEQDTLDGTAGSLWRAKDFLSGRFVVLNGDDLYGREDVELVIESDDWIVGAAQSLEGGKIALDEEGRVTDFVEGKRTELAPTSTNLFGLDVRVFEYPLIPKAEGSSEYGLPQTVLAASKASGIPLKTITTSFWLQVTAPEDLARTEEALRVRKK